MKMLITKRRPPLLSVLFAGVLIVGCNQSNPSADSKAVSPDGAKYLLTAEPTGGKPVKQVRKDAKDGDDVVVVGFIGGADKPWIEGRAGFWIVDPALLVKEADGSMCYDCCEVPPDELRQGKATIKVVDAKGQTVGVDAQQLLNVKMGQTVVVRGKAKRDQEGNLTVLADGVFVRR